MEIGSLQNKIAALADPLPLRYILGRPSSTLSITNLLLKGDNLVVDLSDIGDEPAAILGAIIIKAFKQAADETKIRRATDFCKIPTARRTPSFSHWSALITNSRGPS
jgi:hypothetical protein